MAMTRQRLERVVVKPALAYRIPFLLFMTVSVAIFAAAIAGALVLKGRWSHVFIVGIAVLAVYIVTGYHGSGRLALTPDGIVVRHLLRTRAIPWSDVEYVRLEQTRVGRIHEVVMGSRTMGRVVVPFAVGLDDTGRVGWGFSVSPGLADFTTEIGTRLDGRANEAVEAAGASWLPWLRDVRDRARRAAVRAVVGSGVFLSLFAVGAIRGGSLGVVALAVAGVALPAIVPVAVLASRLQFGAGGDCIRAGLPLRLRAVPISGRESFGEWSLRLWWLEMTGVTVAYSGSMMLLFATVEVRLVRMRR